MAGTTGTAGTDGGTAGSTAGTTGTAGRDGGTAGSTAGTDGGTAGSTAGTDGGTAGNTAGTDGGTAGSTAGTDGGTAGTDGGTAGTDAGTDASDAGAADASDAGDASDAECTNACTLTATRCGTNGGVQTCVMGQSTCTVWGTETACGTHSQCSVTGSTAACGCKVDPNCGSATDQFCVNGTTLGTCAVDGDGCFFASTPTSCPAHESCTGTKPSAVCSCDPTPSDCSGVGGSTCTTGTSLTTCTDDPTTHCIYISSTKTCGSNQVCSGGAGTGACICNAPPAGCTTAANVGNFCNGNESDNCAQDADNCFVLTVNRTCGARQTCTGAGSCQCNAGGCSTAGKFCDGAGHLATCTADGDGCFFVNGAAQTCGTNQTCSGAAGGAACMCNPVPSACVGGVAGTFCSGGNSVTTCAPDADTCIVVSGTAACGARQTCTGTAPAQACQCNPGPAGCTGSGTFCSSLSTQSTCQPDADGCFFVDAATGTTSCPAHESCKTAGLGQTCTCDNTCTPAQAGGGAGTYCLDTLHQASCTTDGNSCRTSSNTVACVGTQTCQGADGAGTCQCQPLGVTAGTGCGSLGATICQGNTVLTCTLDNIGACNVWAQPNPCAAGLVCGTKVGGGASACQCAEHSGNDYIVDPFAGSDAQTGVFPTGNDSPEECRYGTLGKGLSVATSGNRVVAKTDPANLPRSFAAEAFPLVVGAGVTLTTADGVPTPANYTIDFNGATAAVSLGTTSTIEGFTILNNGGNAAASAISITGTGAAVDTVALEGAGGTTLANGISVTGGGQADINGATLSGFTTGLTVSTTAAAAVTMENSSIGTVATGVSLANGTLTAHTVTINGGSGVGVAITAAPAAISTLNGTLLTVSNMAGGGITESATGGTTLLNYVSGDLGHNGATGAKGGINIASGTANTLGTVNVHDNTGVGITQSAGTVTLGSGGTTTVQTSSKQGVSITAGTLNVGPASITGNTLDGVKATTSSIVNFNTGAVISSNGGDGVIENSATLNFVTTAAAPIAVTGNTGDGIGLTAGALTAKYLTVSSNANGISIANAAVVALGVATDGAVLIQNNTQNGVLVNGTPSGNLDMEKSTVKGNGVDGISIDLGAGGAATGKFISVAVTGNTKNGIEVLRAPLNAGVINLTFDSMTISGNGAAGVTLTGASGNVGASLTNSTVTANTGVGVNVAQGLANTTTETLQNDTITNNKGGGITFSTGSTLNGFFGNTVAGNTGDQIVVSARQNGAGNPAWNFQASSSSCGDTTHNSIYCYTSPGVGIRVNAAPATSVNAENVTWVKLSPTAGTDYVVTGTNTLSTSGGVGLGPCTPITTCP